MKNQNNTHNQIQMIGTYNNTFFRDERNGWTRFSMRISGSCSYRNRDGSITCIGHIPSYKTGTPLEVSGTWHNSGYGMQFHISQITEKSIDETVTIEYLTGICTGVGKVTATNIVEKFGADIFSFIQQENARELLQQEIKNVDADKLIAAIRNNIMDRKVYEYIIKFGGLYASAVKMCKKHGGQTLKKLKSNPYLTGLDGDLSFETCDQIAKNEGILAFDEKRIQALIMLAIYKGRQNGHTYATLEEVTWRVNNIVKTSAYPNEIPTSLIAVSATESKYFALEKATPIRIYGRSTWFQENEIVHHIARLTNSANPLSFDSKLIQEAETKLNIKYGAKQQEAFELMRNGGVKILTGGPGTGKTTIIQGLIHCYKQMMPEKSVALCAPTGRAAQKMSEATGMEATTIHKLLDFKPFGEDHSYKTMMDPVNAGLIIVDEFSMVDNELMAILLGAIKNESLVLLVGDENQLESVGAGNILHDLIKSGKLETCKLDFIYRQEEDSVIIENSQKINSGQCKLNTGPDFEIIRVDTSQEAQQHIIDLANAYYTQEDPYGFQVLSPVRKGASGIYEINKLLQEHLNSNTKQVVYGNSVFKIGDKAMTLSNNYDKGYVNGDIGVITAIDGASLTLNLNGKQIEIEKNLLDDVALCYAMSIHKSQGSEFPVVAIILPEQPQIMLKRKLIYTAVTRARDKVVIISVKNALETAILNQRNCKRNTGLYEKLIGNTYDVIPLS